MSKAAELAALIGSQSAQSNKNMIINGAYQIAQRGTTSTAVGADGVSGYHNVDRWRIDINDTSAGRVTMAQTAVTDLAGFANSMKITCTTTDTSIAAGEALIFNQRVEGQNIQRLTATSTSTNAFTLSFYAKSNASRAIASEINFTNGTNRQISKLHTIGTSWARYTMTVPAASNTQIDDDNSHELSVNFWLHAGSTFTSGTINDDALDSITNANRAAGIGSIFASTDNFFEITGVQLELGEVATPFEHRSFADDLALCQRYYQKSYDTTEDPGTSSNTGKLNFVIGAAANATFRFGAEFRVSMRAAPTFTVRSTTGATGNVRLNNSSDLSATTETPGNNAASIYITRNASLGDFFWYHFEADAEL
tara:strand:+ start:959 stop:2056 length:1098 start_codon:yes stop_codon:yes gene_type:complete